MLTCPPAGPMSSAPSPLLTPSRQDETLVLALRGEWDIRQQPPGFETLSEHFADDSGPARVAFDTTGLDHYDSSLISLLLQIHRRCEEKEASFDRDSLPDGINQLLDMALAVPEKRDARAGVTERDFFFSLGQASLDLVSELFDLLHFLGECILSFGRLLTGRARFRRRDFWVIIQECGAEALPIVSLISGLIGMIFAFVGAYQMAGIGTTIYVANLVAIAMAREMGCIMTGIIMSGRTGAAFAAQIGSMKINEEIDALKTFGFSPIDFLVLPRMLALIIMMPLLTIYANIVGMAGGMLVGLGFDISMGQYIAQTISALDLKSLGIGIGKSVIFGVIIAAAGCLRGMQSGSSASAVGTAATSAVVVSITAIILTDSLFAILTTVFGF